MIENNNHGKKILLIGGGGHAKVAIDAFRSSQAYEIAGIIDNGLPRGEEIEGCEVLGADGDLPDLFRKGIRLAFVAVGSVGDASIRKRIAASLKEIGFEFPAAVHATAQVAPSAEVGAGVLVAAGAVVQPGARLGDHAIINTRAVIDHDCRIGSFVHVAPGVTLSGGVTIEDAAHIGTGSTVIENRTIGAGALIGAGSVVVNDIPPRCRAFGNPCRPQK